MRTPQSYLKEIENLRLKHTENWKAERWHLNDTISRKIREAWAAYHLAVERTKDIPR